MRILRNLIITLLLAALLAISVVGVMIEMPGAFGKEPTRIHELGRSFLTVMRPGELLFGVWLGLSLACILVLFMTIWRPRKQMKIEVQMGGGRVVILDSAIKRYIRSALAELPGVTVRRIDLRDTRLGVSTDIYADVRTQGNLPVLQRQMIQRTRAALAEDLGITSISEVHVFIRDFEMTERMPVHTAARRPQERENRAEEAEPEPAHTVELTRPTSAEYTKPSPSTGPFDQVPAPAAMLTRGSSKTMAPSHTARENEPEPETNFKPYAGTAEPGITIVDDKDKYFTAVPSGSGAKVTDLGPKDVYAMSEASGELDKSELVSGGAESDTAEKPRKRGIFGLFGSSEPAVKTNDPVETETAQYDPQTATESVEATVAPESAPAEPAAGDSNSTLENPTNQ